MDASDGKSNSSLTVALGELVRLMQELNKKLAERARFGRRYSLKEGQTLRSASHPPFWALDDTPKRKPPKLTLALLLQQQRAEQLRQKQRRFGPSPSWIGHPTVDEQT